MIIWFGPCANKLLLFRRSMLPMIPLLTVNENGKNGIHEDSSL